MSVYRYKYIRVGVPGEQEFTGYYWDNKGLDLDGSNNNVKKQIIKKNPRCTIIEISKVDDQK